MNSSLGSLCLATVLAVPSLAHASYEFKTASSLRGKAALAAPIWSAVKASPIPLRYKLKAGALILSGVLQPGGALTITKAEGGRQSWDLSHWISSRKIEVSPSKVMMESNHAKVNMQPSPHHDIHFRRTVVEVLPNGDAAATTTRGIRNGKSE